MKQINRDELRQLNEKVSALRTEMMELESSLLADQKSLYDGYCRSAGNLVHYLALRRHDIRQVQAQLAARNSWGKRARVRFRRGISVMFRRRTRRCRPIRAPRIKLSAPIQFGFTNCRYHI